MREEGLLEAEVKYRDDAPNSKVYHITDAGRAELRRWPAEPGELTRHREALLIKVFFGSLLEKASVTGIWGLSLLVGWFASACNWAW